LNLSTRFIAQGIEFSQKIGFEQEVATFFYEVNIPFNVVQYLASIKAMKATFESQTYYKPLSYHGLHIDLVKESKVDVSKQVIERTFNSQIWNNHLF
jgi:hypothetical protein